MPWGLVGRQSHACARRARFPPIARAVLRERRRTERADGKQKSFEKHRARRAEMGERTLDPRTTIAPYISATGDDAHVAPLEVCARG